MPDTPRCGLPHYTWPETVCTEPAGYYRPNIDPHAGPLIIDGRQPGGCAWDEPATPEPPTPDDDYAQATGHEITCTAGAFPGPFQVWPLARILRDVAVGSGDWTWDEEWADLDQRHAETGYLDTLEQQIRDNGITMPVLIGNDGRLWDGHHRLRIAVRLGIAYVPVEITPAAGTTADDPPASSRAADSLRQRLAEALHQHGMVHLGNDAPGDEYDCCADAVLTALAPELAELADYRNRTTWETTCGTCARLLDASYAETARAETAEAALAQEKQRQERYEEEIVGRFNEQATDMARRTGQAEARIAAVRDKATEWAALAPPDDWADTPGDTALADAGRYLLALIDPPANGKVHHYLSTGCLHGEHGYCQGRTGRGGAKKPATCKFCDAQCACHCHQETAADPMSQTASDSP